MRNRIYRRGAEILIFGAALVLVPCGRSQTTPFSNGEQELRERIAAFLSRTVSTAVIRIANIDPPDPSGLRRVVIRLGDAADAQADTYYVTADGRGIIQGTLRPLISDPWRQQRENVEFLMKGAPSTGSPTAPVVLLVFSDLQCPYCSQFDAQLRSLEHEMPDTLRVVFKHFPLEKIHPWARLAARSAVCLARQSEERFWTFERSVFDQQKSIVLENATSRCRELAANSGADLTQYDACVASAESNQAVDVSLADGKKLGVSGVPTMFLNGRSIPGAISAETLRALISNEATLMKHHGSSGTGQWR